MRYLLIIVAFITWNVTCSTGKTMAGILNRSRNVEENRALNSLARRVNQFSLNLFQRYSRIAPGNFILGPCEYFILHSMAPYESPKNGLQESRTDVPVVTVDSVNRSLGLQALVGKIDSYKSFNFTWINKIFHHVDFQPRAEFGTAIQNISRDQPQVLDFNNPTKASEVINEWSNITTQDRISNLVVSDDLTPGVALIVVNAIYFKGVWSRPFTPVGHDVFHVNSKKQIKIPFMKQLDFFEHGELPNIDAQFIRIPYEVNGLDNEISMFILLPNSVDGIGDLKNKIKDVKIAQFHRGQLKELLLFMPKFNIQNKFSITKPLENQRSTKTFINGTGNSEQLELPLRISKFIQTVNIEVDEKSEFSGTNASPVPGTPKLIVNHPFIFFIATNKRNRVILLTGYYTGSEYKNL